MAEILCENDNFAIKQEIKTMKKNIFKFFIFKFSFPIQGEDKQKLISTWIFCNFAILALLDWFCCLV